MCYSAPRRGLSRSGAGSWRGETQASRPPAIPAEVALIFPLFLAEWMEAEVVRGRLAGVRGRMLRKETRRDW